MAGDFHSEEIGATWRVAVRGGGLVLERRGADPEPLVAVSSNVFRGRDLGEVVFERGPSGDPARLEITVGESKIPFLALRR